ncbi:MAG: magnesium transporter [Thiogranum sp.]|nr:magnesium transporter [Thiogranum sp.]
MKSKPDPEQQPDYLELLQQALESGSAQLLADRLDELHPAQIADVLEALPRDWRRALWRQVDAPSKGQILLEVHGEVRGQLIGVTDDRELIAALVTLQPDELADLDAELPASVTDALIEGMSVRRRNRYEAIRSYPDDTAGGLMDVDAAAVRSDVSLKAVLRYLRQFRAREGALPEHMNGLMVVDRENTYLGMLGLGDVVSLPPEARVKDVMSDLVPAVPVLMPASRVARLFEDQDLISAPVVSDTGKLLGRITIDDVVDVMRGEAEHEVMSRAGLTGQTDMFAPVLSNAARRAVWLGVNLTNAFIAAWVIGLFEGSIEKIVALAVLMPVVASMGGVAGNQTLTLVTRGIALEQIGRGNILHLLLREAASGLLNGLFWALVVAGVAIFWFGDARLGLVFGFALMLNLLMGVVAGTLLPLFLQKLGIDPALAGSVVLTATTDIVGFAVFLGLATLLLL